MTSILSSTLVSKFRNGLVFIRFYSEVSLSHLLSPLNGVNYEWTLRESVSFRGAYEHEALVSLTVDLSAWLFLMVHY